MEMVNTAIKWKWLDTRLTRGKEMQHYGTALLLTDMSHKKFNSVLPNKAELYLFTEQTNKQPLI
jgi:hypothetical protein